MTRRIKMRSNANEWEGSRKAPIWLVALLGILLSGSAMIGMYRVADGLAQAREAEAYASELNLLVSSSRALNASGAGPSPGSQLQSAQAILALEPAVIALEQLDSGSAGAVRSAFDGLKLAAADAQQAILTGQGDPIAIDAAVGTSADLFSAAVTDARANLHRQAVQMERWFIIFAAAVFAAAGFAVSGLIFMIGRQRSAASNVRFREQGRFRAMTSMSNDVMSLLDNAGRVQVQSASLLRLLGRSDLWMTGRSFADIVHPEERDAFGDLLTQAHASSNGAEALTGTFRLSHGDGGWRVFDLHATKITPADGEPESVLLTGREPAATASARPESPAFTHTMSGLLTEAIFADRLEHALVRASRSASPISLLAIDLGLTTDFALLPDESRATALRSIGGRLTRAVRSSDSVGHLGNDELMILLDDTDDIVARGIAKRVLEQLEIPVSLLDRRIALKPRIGIAVKTDPRDTAAGLLESARRAVTEHPVDGPAPAAPFDLESPAATSAAELPATWAAAAMGRGLHATRQTEQLSPSRLTEQPVDVVLSQTVAVAVAEPVTVQTPVVIGDAVDERVVAAAQLPATAELIPEPETVPVAQVAETPVPVFDPSEFDIQFVPALALETGEIIELELLARWRHPQRGLVSLDLSGKGAAAVPWLLEEACRVAAGLPTTRTGEAIRISVNLPASAPLNDELVDTVAGTLLTSGLTPGALQLEIAARALDADPERREGAQAVLAQLRQLGVRVALDGAGAEIERLPDFVTLPINAVKIDRSVISLLDRSADRRAVVRSIVELARPHGITVNGTGVETLDQAERLWDLGADEGQGPLFFRPVSEDQLGALFSGDALVAAD